MTKQEIFNRVWNHFIVEKNPPSFAKTQGCNPVCMYRGPNGTKCAVGILIPDEEYHEDMEKKGVYGLRKHDLLPPSLRNLSEEHYTLMTRLQSAHDDYARGFTSFNTFKERLEVFTWDYGLTIPA